MKAPIFYMFWELIFGAIIIWISWTFIYKPIASYVWSCIKGIVELLLKPYSYAVSVGYKLISNPKEKVIGEKGELTDGAALIDKVATPNYLIADWVKGHPVENMGYVLFRGYKTHLERCLVIEGSTSMQRKFGKRFQLPNLPGNYAITDERYVDMTIEEVKKLAESNVAVLESKPSLATPVAVPVIVKEPAIAENPVKTSTPEVKKAKPLETYKGYLISYGKATRHISSKDGDAETGKEIEQFRVLIKGDDGVEESIWGQDLLRAIKDANINLNDMVEVVKTGKRQNGNSWKNLYAVNKLA
jgi:hypothetical protein